MDGNGGDWHRRINWTLFWTAIGSLAAVAALFLALDVLPTSESSDSKNPPTVESEKGEPEKEPAESGADPKAGEKLWEGEISLVVDNNYALDGFPIEQFEGFCDGCIQVNSFGSDPSLEADNGVRDWSQPTPPDYEDCVQLLESGPAPFVSLVASPNSEGVEVGEWACATSKSGEILRLRYLGVTQDEVNFRFAAIGWRKPS